mgnify:CR=1 FL=1
MRVNPVTITPIAADKTAPAARSATVGGPDSFQASLKSAVRQVNDLQSQADKLAVKMVAGELEDVHQAMLAMQKASLAMQFAVQVRNKVIEAYQEIMRMQV